MVRLAHKLALPVATVVLLLSVTSGCTFFKELIGAGPQRPIVKVKQIEVKNASLLAIDLQVTLQIDNPNSFELRLSKLRYSISSLDLPIASGAYAEALVVGAKSRGLVKLPVSIDSQNAVKLAKEFLQSTKELSATVKADALFDSPVGEMEVNFEDERPLGRLGGI